MRRIQHVQIMSLPQSTNFGSTLEFMLGIYDLSLLEEGGTSLILRAHTAPTLQAVLGSAPTRPQLSYARSFLSPHRQLSPVDPFYHTHIVLCVESPFTTPTVVLCVDYSQFSSWNRDHPRRRWGCLPNWRADVTLAVTFFCSGRSFNTSA